MPPVIDKNDINNPKILLPAKLSRKKFFLFSAVSAISIYSLFKMPFKFLFDNKIFTANKNDRVKISQNPDAVSRTPGRQNG